MFYILNNLCCKQNHTFAQQDPICAYLRLGGVNAHDYIICAPSKIVGRGHAPSNHEKSQCAQSHEIFVNLNQPKRPFI